MMIGIENEQGQQNFTNNDDDNNNKSKAVGIEKYYPDFNNTDRLFKQRKGIIYLSGEVTDKLIIELMQREYLKRKDVKPLTLLRQHGTRSPDTFVPSEVHKLVVDYFVSELNTRLPDEYDKTTTQPKFNKKPDRVYSTPSHTTFYHVIKKLKEQGKIGLIIQKKSGGKKMRKYYKLLSLPSEPSRTP